jgi:hypothetical protein
MTKYSKLCLAAAGIAVAMAGSSSALAQSADALIDKLVDKGVLSVKEANELREEADKGFTQAYSVKSGMPEWVSALKLNGDFRGRYEGFFADNPGFEDRNRFRYRARFGVTAVMSDSFEVGLRLGSGDIDGGATVGTDPISQNQTFQNNAAKKGIFIDLAYGKWTPINTGDWSVATTIGKMENPYVFSDMVFDADYTPEGAAIQIGRNLGDKHAIKLNSGAFVIDELAGTTQDPFMFGAQARLESTWTPRISTSVGAAYMAMMNPEQLGNAAVPNINVGNTRNAAGNLVYDYTPVVVDASATYKLDSFPMYSGPFPIKVGGDYIYNDGASSAADNEGWSAGVLFGKAGKRGTWEIAYTYKWLGADAWWEEVVDSDSGAFYAAGPANSGQGAGYRTGTNVKGHVMRVAYSPYDSLTLTAKAFLMERIDIPDDSEMTRLQVDAQWKF